MSKLQNMFALCSLFWSSYADTCAAGKFAHPLIFLRKFYKFSVR